MADQSEENYNCIKLVDYDSDDSFTMLTAEVQADVHKEDFNDITVVEEHVEDGKSL